MVSIASVLFLDVQSPRLNLPWRKSMKCKKFWYEKKPVLRSQAWSLAPEVQHVVKKALWVSHYCKQFTFFLLFHWNSEFSIQFFLTTHAFDDQTSLWLIQCCSVVAGAGGAAAAGGRKSLMFPVSSCTFTHTFTARARIALTQQKGTGRRMDSTTQTQQQQRVLWKKNLAIN